MKTYLKTIYRREMFNPKLIGFFFHHNFTIRKGIYRGVKNNASFLKGKLLDFGCGNKPYKDLFNVEEYIGLDIETNTNQYKKNFVDYFYDGTEIPFPSEYFDCVFSSEVLEHIPNTITILEEINRVCKPNGYLLITVPFVWVEHDAPFDFVRYTSYGIKKLLVENGFDVVKQTKTSDAIQTIFQLWNVYVHHHILKYKIPKIILNPFFITPTLIIGILLSKILPKNDSLFLNNIVLAKKNETIH